MNITKVVKSLSNEIGISGEECKVAELALSYMKKYTDDTYIKNGNVIGNIGERAEGKTHIVLDAHIDQIGFIVTFITDDGFIKVGNCGGIDRRLVLAQQVTIHGQKDICGIIISTPPHLDNGDEKKVPEISDIYIDTGMSKTELEKIVEQGDRISFVAPCEDLLGGRLTGKALDDRTGVAAILYALDSLKKDELNCSVTAVFSTQEEIGERGAKIAAYDINADIAIAVDVGFGFTDGDEEGKCGKLGNGGMIGVSPSLDRELSNELAHIAKKEKIPYQFEVMEGLTSTNADQYSVSRGGARAVTLSIPLKYMHTPVEVVDVSDIKNVGKLLAEFIRRCK